MAKGSCRRAINYLARSASLSLSKEKAWVSKGDFFTVGTTEMDHLA